MCRNNEDSEGTAEKIYFCRQRILLLMIVHFVRNKTNDRNKLKGKGIEQGDIKERKIDLKCYF